MPQAGKGLSWLGFVLRIGAAAIWIVAGAAKIPTIQTFVVLVQRYAILPTYLAVPFAYLLPFFEIGLGLYLAAGLFVRGAAFVGTVLFAVFLTAQISALARELALDCGCFGTIVQTTVGPLTLIRDFCLGIPTFVMLFFPSRKISIDARWLGKADQFPA